MARDLTVEVVAATTNPHKIDEIRAVLTPLGIEVTGLDTLDVLPPEPVEDVEGLEAGDSVVLQARFVETSTCMQGTTLEVVRVLPPPR